MDLEVGRELIDAGGEQGHLDFGRAGVGWRPLELRDDLRLGQMCNGHGKNPLNKGLNLRTRLPGAPCD